MKPLPELKLPPRLRTLPELRTHEIHAGALTHDHIGSTIAVRTPDAVLAGPLTSITESRLEGRARLILTIATNDTIGDLPLGVHPSHPVTVLPDGHTLTVTATVRPPGALPPDPAVRALHVPDGLQHFRSRVHQVTAIRWTGDNTDDLIRWTGGRFTPPISDDQSQEQDEPLSGTAELAAGPHGRHPITVDLGDWIVHRAGIFTALSPDRMADRYQQLHPTTARLVAVIAELTALLEHSTLTSEHEPLLTHLRATLANTDH